MPEVCEVHITAQYLLRKIKNRYLTKVNVVSGKYLHMKMEGLDELSYPLKIKDIKTKGKFLYFILEDSLLEPVYLLCNFGLTGGYSFLNVNSIRISFEIKNKTKDKKYKLHFYDQRNFGLISFTKDINVLNEKLDKLASDLLQNSFTDDEYYNDFTNFLKKYPTKKKLILVKFLMGQNKNETTGSGLGNYLTAEILYDAKLSPHRELQDLSKKEIKTLANSIKKLVKICYWYNKTGYMERNQNLENFVETHQKDIINGKLPDYHKDLKLSKNDFFEFKVYQQKEDPDGNEVIPDKIITGRTTYWVPSVQK